MYENFAHAGGDLVQHWLPSLERALITSGRRAPRPSTVHMVHAVQQA